MAMHTDYQKRTEEVLRLDRALESLLLLAGPLGVEPPTGEEWYELLRYKLVPQLGAEPLLVVAVVGGTNIGKSVVFNHLVSETASAVSPLAAGTRHPVCLVPAGLDAADLLPRLFEGFDLIPWHAADDPLKDAPEHRLFWRTGAEVPERLLVLDTPDIDSDARVNWQRADHIRQAADVLIAVLTQQKYNDAAVKRFFRAAVEADKPVIIVFNQCDLKEDRAYWPLWLETFTRETGARPELVYVVPYDREAANAGHLPFYEVGPDGRRDVAEASRLRDELAELHFATIKLRTLDGAIERVVDEGEGMASFLRRFERTSNEFAAARDALAETGRTKIQWPALPARLLVDEIRAWWDQRRSPWARRVHGVYRSIGTAVLVPAKAVRDQMVGPRKDPETLFAEQERTAIITAVEALFGELERLAEVGNDTLRPRIQKILGGDVRGRLLADLERSHAELPTVDEEFRTFLRQELDAWSNENPSAVRWMRSLDHVVAIARPAITVSLAVSGWIVAGGIVHEAAVQAAGHTAADLATEAAITTGITGGGEALVGTTAEGLRRAAAQMFRRLQVRFAAERAHWLANWLERELLGDLLEDLRQGAEASTSEAFQDAQRALANLRVGA